MITYKVVTKDRKSVFVSKKLCLKYEKGTIVKALSYTAGCMCFKTYKDAINFIDGYCSFIRKTIIIKVKGIGKSRRPFGMLSSFLVENNINKKIFNYYIHPGTNFPEGTICFSAVEVLE